eukprot:1933683-Pleurochrysis_carterae.AAC.1
MASKLFYCLRRLPFSNETFKLRGGLLLVAAGQMGQMVTSLVLFGVGESMSMTPVRDAAIMSTSARTVHTHARVHAQTHAHMHAHAYARTHTRAQSHVHAGAVAHTRGRSRTHSRA